VSLQRKTRLRPGKPLARGPGPKRTSWPSKGGSLTPKRAPLPSSNAKRKRKRRAAHHGTKARSQDFYTQPCACARGKRHPACTPGDSQPSHTRHFHGDKTTIIPQSDGCHRSVTNHGWAQWEAATGLDKDVLAAHYATQGPDAPLPLPGDPT
jgi:hypothetical protein